MKIFAYASIVFAYSIKYQWHEKLCFHNAIRNNSIIGEIMILERRITVDRYNRRTVGSFTGILHRCERTLDKLRLIHAYYLFVLLCNIVYSWLLGAQRLENWKYRSKEFLCETRAPVKLQKYVYHCVGYSQIKEYLFLKNNASLMIYYKMFNSIMRSEMNYPVDCPYIYTVSRASVCFQGFN